MTVKRKVKGRQCPFCNKRGYGMSVLTNHDRSKRLTPIRPGAAFIPTGKQYIAHRDVCDKNPNRLYHAVWCARIEAFIVPAPADPLQVPPPPSLPPPMRQQEKNPLDVLCDAAFNESGITRCEGHIEAAGAGAAASMVDHAGAAGQLAKAADEQQDDEVGTQSSCVDATEEYCPPSEALQLNSRSAPECAQRSMPNQVFEEIEEAYEVQIEDLNGHVKEKQTLTVRRKAVPTAGDVQPCVDENEKKDEALIAQEFSVYEGTVAAPKKECWKCEPKVEVPGIGQGPMRVKIVLALPPESQVSPAPPFINGEGSCRGVKTMASSLRNKRKRGGELTLEEHGKGKDSKEPEDDGNIHMELTAAAAQMQRPSPSQLERASGSACGVERASGSACGDLKSAGGTGVSAQRNGKNRHADEMPSKNTAGVAQGGEERSDVFRMGEGGGGNALLQASSKVKITTRVSELEMKVLGNTKESMALIQRLTELEAAFDMQENSKLSIPTRIAALEEVV
jgi:hypothetical protein